MWAVRCAFILVVGLAFVQGGSYDYGDLIRKSLLFYQAQRSGYLWGMDPLLYYRGDSGLYDRGHYGEDLIGGYYDAADLVKFGLPMAYTVTMLSWGVIDFEGTYANVGALDEVRNAIRWGTDYFMKCHVSANEFYGQVGNGAIDHAWFGRPEDMSMERPAYKIDVSNPGSDLAAETAAALAAASIVFYHNDQQYAGALLGHAKELFNFADTYRGKYSDSITDAREYYASSGYEDELVWGAVWMHRATGEQWYLDKAIQYYYQWNIQYRNSPISWDEKSMGAVAVLARVTNGQDYKNTLQSFCDGAFYNQQRTPKGLIFYSEWGSLRMAANVAFLCLQAAEMGIKPDEYTWQAKQQIDYALGDGGRSFVVGFGNNPPTHEQHRAATCPDRPADCNWDTFNGAQPNAHTLWGALVGGPGANDDYTDYRGDYVHNEVACDYNAGFQGALVNLKARGY